MSFLLRFKSGRLSRDTELLCNMSPYLRCRAGAQDFEGQVCEAGGTKPIFEDCFHVKEGAASQVAVQVWDKDTFSDDLVG
jgi:hypothetical protein